MVHPSHLRNVNGGVMALTSKQGVDGLPANDDDKACIGSKNPLKKGSPVHGHVKLSQAFSTVSNWYIPEYWDEYCRCVEEADRATMTVITPSGLM